MITTHSDDLPVELRWSPALRAVSLKDTLRDGRERGDVGCCKRVHNLKYNVEHVDIDFPRSIVVQPEGKGPRSQLQAEVDSDRSKK